MKLFLILILLVVFHLSSSWAAPVSQTVRRSSFEFERLLDAIAIVESAGNAQSISDSGRAVGLFQIHKIYVEDVNRFSAKKFTYADRLDPTKSREMIKLYLQHYGKGKSLEQLGRIHNGGPNGWKKESTKKYWLKVKKVLETK